MTKRLIAAIGIGLTLAGGWIGVVPGASAYGIDTTQSDLTKANGLKSQPFTTINKGTDVTQTIFRVALVVSVILFVILLLVGGVQYLASFGNEEATTKAKKLIIDAVVGLFIVLAVFGIAAFVFGQLGLQLPPSLLDYLRSG